MRIIIKTKIGADGRVKKIKKEVEDILDKSKIGRTQRVGSADLAVIIGGDGTFLFWQSKLSCPMFGIRDRGVGYYMSATGDDFLNKLKKIISGRAGRNFRIYKLARLAAAINGKPLPAALNEYLISSGNTREMFNCTLRINGRNSTERNSGIIVYTPSGSNAFAGAAGAKSMLWNSKKIGVIAVAPYSGKLTRGSILAEKENVILECLNSKGEICVDGQKKYTYKIKKGDKITIKKNNDRASVICF